MGADGWAELAPWREDPEGALRALHARVISTLDIPDLIQRAMRDTQEQITIWESEGDPYELVKGYKEHLAELEAAARGRLPTEVDDQAALVRLCCLDRSEGLGNILDVHAVSGSGGFLMARPLTETEMICCFGSVHPTSKAAPRGLEVLPEISRGEAVCFPVYDEQGSPAGWWFTGYRID